MIRGKPSAWEPPAGSPDAHTPLQIKCAKNWFRDVAVHLLVTTLPTIGAIECVVLGQSAYAKRHETPRPYHDRRVFYCTSE